MVIVKNNTPRLQAIAGYVQLWPGMNEVTDALWAKCEPLIDYQLKVNDIEVIRRDAPEDNPLAGMKPAAAKEVISETYDIKKLQKWRESETRKGVLSALEKQEHGLSVELAEERARYKAKAEEAGE